MPEMISLLINAFRPFHRTTPPGAVPGTVVAHADAATPRISVIAYDEQNCLDRTDVPVDDLPALIEHPGVTWVNVDGLGDADIIHRIGEICDLHPLALEDVVHVHQRAKVEEYPNCLFLVARMVSLQPRLQTEQVSLFLSENFVVTFQEWPGDCLDAVRERIRNNRGRIRYSGSDYLAYALMDGIIDGYFPVVEEFANKLDELEDEVAEMPDRETIGEIHAIRSDLRLLRRTIWPLREAVNLLQRGVHRLIQEPTLVYFRDCYDHTGQLMDAVETYREMCSDLRDFHYAQQSQRTNDVMKVLTIIATIFIPLGFVAGLYGMNFDPHKSPWNMPELEWTYGYPFALGLMSLMAISLLIFFWRKGWLSG